MQLSFMCQHQLRRGQMLKKLQFPKTVDSNWMHWFGFRNHDPVFCICMEVPSGCLSENMDTLVSGEYKEGI